MGAWGAVSPTAVRPPRTTVSGPTTASRPTSRWTGHPVLRVAGIGTRPEAASRRRSAWQSSSQSGTYSHVVNGVTLAGSFSQSASLDDRSRYTTGGGVGASGWVPTGSGSDVLATSAGNSFSGSGSAVGVPPLGGTFSDWVSTGTQSEQEAQARARTTPHSSRSRSPPPGRAIRPPRPLGEGQGVRVIGRPPAATGRPRAAKPPSPDDSGAGQYTAYSGTGVYGGSIQGAFSQSQGESTSWGFSTDDALQLALTSAGGGNSVPSPSGRGAGGEGYWQAVTGTGTTVVSGGDGFSYSGTGNYAGSDGASGTMGQNGGASESFSYTKDYAIDGSGNWQVASDPGGNGASGSGWTFSSYSGTVPFRPPCPPSPPTRSSGGTRSPSAAPSSRPAATAPPTASRPPPPSTASTGARWARRPPPAAAARATPSSSSWIATIRSSPRTSDRPAAAWSCTHSNATSYGYTEQAYLNDNGTWQNLPSPSGGGAGGTSNWFAAAGSQTWELVGYGDATVYGNALSGALNVSGGGTDSYAYSLYFNYSPSGTWQAAGGAGNAWGSGSVAWGYSGGGSFSALESSSANTYIGAGASGTAAAVADAWRGWVAGSGSDGESFSYYTSSTYSPAGGWTNGGGASYWAWGSTSSTFSASSPYALAAFNGAGGTGSLSGTVSGSGFDQSSYSFSQSAAMSSNGTWQAGSGSGSAWGSSSQDWSYSGAGVYSQNVDTSYGDLALAGTAGDSGSMTFGSSYNASARYSGAGWYYTGTGCAMGVTAYSSFYSAGSSTGGSPSASFSEAESGSQEGGSSVRRDAYAGERWGLWVLGTRPEPDRLGHARQRLRLLRLGRYGLVGRSDADRRARDGYWSDHIRRL